MIRYLVILLAIQMAIYDASPTIIRDSIHKNPFESNNIPGHYSSGSLDFLTENNHLPGNNIVNFEANGEAGKQLVAITRNNTEGMKWQYSSLKTDNGPTNSTKNYTTLFLVSEQTERPVYVLMKWFSLYCNYVDSHLIVGDKDSYPINTFSYSDITCKYCVRCSEFVSENVATEDGSPGHGQCISFEKYLPRLMLECDYDSESVGEKIYHRMPDLISLSIIIISTTLSAMMFVHILRKMKAAKLRAFHAKLIGA